jgi:hypothetical protein
MDANPGPSQNMMPTVPATSLSRRSLRRQLFAIRAECARERASGREQSAMVAPNCYLAVLSWELGKVQISWYRRIAAMTSWVMRSAPATFHLRCR